MLLKYFSTICIENNNTCITSCNKRTEFLEIKGNQTHVSSWRRLPTGHWRAGEMHTRYSLNLISASKFWGKSLSQNIYNRSQHWIGNTVPEFCFYLPPYSHPFFYIHGLTHIAFFSVSVSGWKQACLYISNLTPFIYCCILLESGSHEKDTQ